VCIAVGNESDRSSVCSNVWGSKWPVHMKHMNNTIGTTITDNGCLASQYMRWRTAHAYVRACAIRNPTACVNETRFFDAFRDGGNLRIVVTPTAAAVVVVVVVLVSDGVVSVQVLCAEASASVLGLVVLEMCVGAAG
jgi:hypothetical protein